jgi:outer membrane lipase/esterase
VNGVNIASPAYQTFYSALQTAVPNAVAQVINPSVNVYYLDTNTLFRRVLDNPGQFGFLPGDCAVIASCRTSNSLAVQNQYAFYQFHPTDALSAIIARYFNVILNGPSTVVPQADIGKAVGFSFNNTLMNRLDAYRSLNTPTAETGPYAAYTKAAARTNTAPVSPGSPLSVFVEGLYAGIDRGPAPAFGSSSESTGLAGLTAGLEYRVMPNLVVGAAFNYFNGRTDFGSNYRSQIDVEAFQGAGFTSLNYRNFFADAALTYGTINYDLQRPGAVGDLITASPRGDVFTAGGKVGYLFDFRPFRIGPIAEMSYANLRIGAYQENGDSLVTMGVQQQNLEGLTAGAGVQARATLPVFGKVINPFLNVTAEHDFLDQVRAIATFQTSAPVLLIHTTANQSSSDIYGKVAGGFSVDFGKGWNGVMSGSATLGRPGGNDFAANVGIRYRL